MDDCPNCEGIGAHTACTGQGCADCDPNTGNCPTCAGTGNDLRALRTHLLR